jgi:cyclopropane fatty-acyl-phospholipid synthase-like methyltransferase
MTSDRKKTLEKWRKQNINKEYQKHIATAEPLKRNSVELVEILAKYDILFNGMKIFEIGCGCGRNLAYINKEGYDIEYFGNDLIKEECFKYMDEDLKGKINFIEEETAILFSKIYNVDLFISSDHFMHLIPQSVPDILEKLKREWSPKHILLRETTVGNKKGKRKWVHDYSVLESDYDYMYRQTSRENDDYIISLLRRKKCDVNS